MAAPVGDAAGRHRLRVPVRRRHGRASRTAPRCRPVSAPPSPTSATGSHHSTPTGSSTRTPRPRPAAGTRYTTSAHGCAADPTSSRTTRSPTPSSTLPRAWPDDAGSEVVELARRAADRHDPDLWIADPTDPEQSFAALVRAAARSEAGAGWLCGEPHQHADTV